MQAKIKQIYCINVNKYFTETNICMHGKRAMWDGNMMKYAEENCTGKENENLWWCCYVTSLWKVKCLQRCDNYTRHTLYLSANFNTQNESFSANSRPSRANSKTAHAATKWWKKNWKQNFLNYKMKCLKYLVFHFQSIVQLKLLFAPLLLLTLLKVHQDFSWNDSRIILKRILIIHCETCFWCFERSSTRRNFLILWNFSKRFVSGWRNILMKMFMNSKVIHSNKHHKY